MLSVTTKFEGSLSNKTLVYLRPNFSGRLKDEKFTITIVFNTL